MRVQVVEQRRAEDVYRGRAPVFDRGADALHSAVLPVVEHHRRGVTQTGLRVGAQHRGERRLREGAVFAFVKDADACQRTQDPVQRVFLNVQERRQFVRAPGTGLEMVGDTELRDGTDGRRVPLREHHFRHGDVGRNGEDLLHGGQLYRLPDPAARQSPDVKFKTTVNDDVSPALPAAGWAPTVSMTSNLPSGATS